MYFEVVVSRAISFILSLKKKLFPWLYVTLSGICLTCHCHMLTPGMNLLDSTGLLLLSVIAMLGVQ